MPGEGISPTPPSEENVDLNQGDTGMVDGGIPIPEDKWTPAMHRRAAHAAGETVYGPGGPEQPQLPVHPGQIGQKVESVSSEAGSGEQSDNSYDSLFDPNSPGPIGSIEDAAVRSDKTPPARTIDRAGYWTPPTNDQIDKGKKDGLDLDKQNKYFPPGQ